MANRSQNWLPSYSVISLSEDAFTIDTYQITDDGTVEKIDDTFTIQESADETSVATLESNGAENQFNVSWNGGVVVTTGAAYTQAVPTTAPTTGERVTLTLTVDGAESTTPALLSGGNYYVPASFLSTLGVSL